jgi:hypothetical protein
LDVVGCGVLAKFGCLFIMVVSFLGVICGVFVCISFLFLVFLIPLFYVIIIVHAYSCIWVVDLGLLFCSCWFCLES